MVGVTDHQTEKPPLLSKSISDHSPRSNQYRSQQSRAMQPGDGMYASRLRKQFYSKYNLKPSMVVRFCDSVGELNYLAASRDGSQLTLILDRTQRPHQIDFNDEFFKYCGRLVSVHYSFLERPKATQKTAAPTVAPRFYIPF